MNKEAISIVIVDDHPIVIEGLRALLEKNEQLKVLACFTNGTDLLHFLNLQSVDIVLLDISLPDISGVDLCLTIKKKYTKTHVLVISNHNERSLIMQMIQNGASGYLLKNSTSDELLKSIRDAIEGSLIITPEVKKILDQGSTKGAIQPRVTKREREVLKMVADGMTTAEIAERLFISPLTVETHRRNLMQKFEVNNSVTMIKLAMDLGII